jgi:hypothetical protein
LSNLNSCAGPPDHVDAALLEHACHFHRTIAKQGPVITRKGYGCDHRQITCFPCRRDRLPNLIQVAKRFDDDQVNARFSQGADLLSESLTRRLRFDSAIWRDPYPQRTDIPSDQHIPERGSHHAFGEVDSCFVDFDDLILKPVLCEFEAIRAKRIGNDQLRARLDIGTMDLCHG